MRSACGCNQAIKTPHSLMTFTMTTPNIVLLGSEPNYNSEGFIASRAIGHTRRFLSPPPKVLIIHILIPMATVHYPTLSLVVLNLPQHIAYMLFPSVPCSLICLVIAVLNS